MVLVTGDFIGVATRAVTLLSPDVEFATPADLLLPRAGSLRPYDLLVESDIFGYVWTDQLDRRLGAVDDGLMNDLTAVRLDESTSRGPAGPPLLNRDDPRWAFKEAELARLRVLTSDCAGYLIDG
ncbi:hypothetical protein [Aeromicrobium sp. 179-A 4D2 NHS]|uniref:hypothetical protein n=1 Tax=Aeromicrobium sp. 179-A 4D2 NHS TaxID=3142375 RepID=UPI0039A2B36F